MPHWIKPVEAFFLSERRAMENPSLRVNKTLLKTAKIFPCPKDDLKLVTHSSCKQCDILDNCPTARLRVTDISWCLPHDAQRKVYDIWIPSQLQLDVEKSDRWIMWHRIVRLLKPDWKMLDLGCGTGRFAKVLELMDFKGRYVGIDWSRERIKEARKYVPTRNYRFLVGDIFNSKLRPHMARFDAVLLLEVIQQVTSVKMIDDFFRNFPNGPVVIFTQAQISTHKAFFDVNNLKKLGLEIDYYEKFNGIGFDLFRARRK